ncbi:AAA domain containing protein [uncultured Caudovirales phage]|uniref:AAA domain containing protein n=1 Tax=uncultured Caudovirales phage TaxID=2100421 RepID=A0A6J5KLX5_9CAUD|nr:AAA domain containing protein [uncultured Caudovirales phage]
MQASQLKPASQLAQRFGVKALAYGGPGTGKTPMVNTAPRPVLCVVEPGMLSMRTSNVPAWEAYDVPRINEFFKWLFTSNEARNYDTVGIDSISQLAEIILTDELKKNKDGRKAYGEMSRAVMEIVNALYYLPQKHVYLIGKQSTVDEGGIMRKKPYFPGQDLNVKIPHMYDEILHIGMNQIAGMPKPTIAIRTAESFDTMARDRSGRLAELEPPDLSALFAKAMT